MSDIPDRIDSKYRYVLLASTRAEQIVEGAAPKAEGDSGKPTRIGMTEVSKDAVEWDYGPAEEPEVEIAEPAESGEVVEATATES